MTRYIFIIPLTPEKLLNSTRNKLQKACFRSLSMQESANWKALCIGKSSNIPDDPRFVQVVLDGLKREKLSIALEFLDDQEIDYRYLIRLDDDDIFNPNVLEELGEQQFDVFVDKTHHFYNPFERKVARKTQYWFPNTYVIKKEFALQEIHSEIPGAISGLSLIEQDHNLHHRFLKDSKVKFANKRGPVYLRSITTESITAKGANNIKEYLNSFGNWKKMNLPDFNWLESIPGDQPIDQSAKTKLKNAINEKRYQQNYQKMVFGT